MKKIFNFLFKLSIVVIAVFLLLAIGLAIYFYVADPYNLKQFMRDPESTADQSESAADEARQSDKHPLLDPEQEASLEQIGVDVAKLPSEITPEMEACFRQKLGDDRVDEIIGGEEPSTLDLLKAGGCISAQ